MITDGTPTTASGHAACPDLEVRLENSNVDIVLILIGESQDDIDAFRDNVTCLDVGSNYNDIYEVTEFTDAAFRMIESLIRNKTCIGTEPFCEFVCVLGTCRDHMVEVVDVSDLVQLFSFQVLESYS